MAEEGGGRDGKHAALLASLAADLDAADTDGNGRISREEAMANDQAIQASAETATIDIGATENSGSGLDGKAAALMKLIELIQSYASADKSSEETGLTGSISLTA